MDHLPSARVGRPEIIQKVTRRLIPFVGICYLIAYIDRQNVSFAKLQMVGDLGLSEYAYGLGASLFFIGYFLFEVPSKRHHGKSRGAAMVRPDHDLLGRRWAAN